MEGVDRDQVRKAVDALLQVVAKNRKKDLFSSDSSKINLQFSFVKAPRIDNTSIKISLPHSLQHETTEVCLFVKDLDSSKREYEPTVDHFESLLKEKDISCISEIIPLKSLKTEYKPFEAKRNLSNRFDVFLADDSIVRFLPTYLGKNFYGRKKFPVQVNLRAQNLKGELRKAIGNTHCHLTGRGACGMVTCAHTGLSPDQITDNIIATINCLATTVPGGGDNLKTFNIKTVDSLSIPIMVKLKLPNSISLPSKKPSPIATEPEEVTTVEEGKIKVSRLGDLILVKDDGKKINLTQLKTKKAGSKFKGKKITGKKRKSSTSEADGSSGKKRKKEEESSVKKSKESSVKKEMSVKESVTSKVKSVNPMKKTVITKKKSVVKQPKVKVTKKSKV